MQGALRLERSQYYHFSGEAHNHDSSTHCQLPVRDSFLPAGYSHCHNADKVRVANSIPPMPVFSYLQMAECRRGLEPLCLVCITWPGFNKAVLAKLCFPKGAFLQSKTIHLPLTPSCTAILARLSFPHSYSLPVLFYSQLLLHHKQVLFWG